MGKLEELKQKLDDKIDKEYEDFIAYLKELPPEQIIQRSYEKVSKEEMIYKIKDRDYNISELKALIKNDNILEECYDEWLKSDGNFNEILEYAVNERIELIIDDYKKEKIRISKESR